MENKIGPLGNGRGLSDHSSRLYYVITCGWAMQPDRSGWPRRCLKTVFLYFVLLRWNGKVLPNLKWKGIRNDPHYLLEQHTVEGMFSQARHIFFWLFNRLSVLCHLSWFSKIFFRPLKVHTFLVVLVRPGRRAGGLIINLKMKHSGRNTKHKGNLPHRPRLERMAQYPDFLELANKTSILALPFIALWYCAFISKSCEAS